MLEQVHWSIAETSRNSGLSSLSFCQRSSRLFTHGFGLGISHCDRSQRARSKSSSTVARIALWELFLRGIASRRLVGERLSRRGGDLQRRGSITSVKGYDGNGRLLLAGFRLSTKSLRITYQTKVWRPVRRPFVNAQLTFVYKLIWRCVVGQRQSTTLVRFMEHPSGQQRNQTTLGK